MDEHKLAIRVEGAFNTRHSLAFCNREFCYAFLRSGKVDLSITPTEPEDMHIDEDPRLRLLEPCRFRRLPGPAEATISHMFPPPWRRAREGLTLVMQPWEYGYVLKHWPPAIEENVDKVLCYSNAVKDTYLRSGVPSHKLAVVPLGVDTSIYNPQAPPYVFTNEPGVKRARRLLKGDPFIILFVGGTLHRKGIDILIKSVLSLASEFDNVIVVVKDYCANTVYRIGNSRAELLRMANDPASVPLIYIDHHLSEYQLAGLYTRAHCLVIPYRGEGFSLTCLEAIACGCPVMTTAGGPTDDYLNDTCSWRVPSVIKPFTENRVGEWECVGMPWMREVSPDVLAGYLREVIGNREEARRRGLAGAEHARAGWTWDHAAKRALDLIQQMLDERDTRFTADTARSLASSPAVPLAHPLTDAQHARILAAQISVCMIVKNEARVLPACLQSLRPLALEVIVADTGSTDRTVEIALSFGAIVIHFEWCNHFAAARNASLKPATGKWILWVDADDTIELASVEAILRAVETAPDNIVGFVIPVQFVESSGAASGTRVDHVKLFRNLPGLEFSGRIHEQILGSLRATGGEIARLPGAVVLHSGYDTSPEGQARKRDRDNKILALEIAERPDDPFVNFNLGMTCHYAGNHPDATKWLRRTLELAHPTDSIVRKAYALLGISYRELGQFEEFERTLDTGLAIYPDDPELNFHLAHLRSEQRRYAEAKVHYMRCLSANIDAHFSSIDMAITGSQGYKTFHNIGGVCLLAGDYAGAREWWLKAIDASPTFEASRLSLFVAALEAKDQSTAADMLQSMRDSMQNGPELWWHTSRYAAEFGDADTAERCLRMILEADPRAVTPRLALAKELLRTDRVVEAEPMLATLSDDGVAEAAFYLGVTNVRNGDYPTALIWMERALSLNPQHVDTRAQVENLRRAIAEGA